MTIHKQAQESIFCRKIKLTAYSQLVLNNNPIHQNLSQKHLGMFLYFNLDLIVKLTTL